MLRIAYSSRSRPPLSSESFDTLVAASVSNNWRDGITGLLLFDGHRFLQAIEGRAEAVERCYARITADPRHHNVVELQRDSGADRQFGDWSLQALDLTVAPSTFQQHVMASVAGVTDEHLRAMFIGFASLAR